MERREERKKGSNWERREREDRNYESRNEGKIDEDAEDEKDDDAARPSDSTGRPPC